MTDVDRSSFPTTPRRAVSDSYHGITVVEEYRWLENYDDPAVRAWTEAQNRYSRALLDTIAARGLIGERLRALYMAVSADHDQLRRCGGRLFAIKNQPPKEQPLLVTLTSADDLASEQVVLDPNQLDPTGATT